LLKQRIMPDKHQEYAQLVEVMKQRAADLLIGNNWLFTREIHKRYQAQYGTKPKESVSAMLHFLEIYGIVKHRRIIGQPEFEWLHIDGTSIDKLFK
jgi:hypothetical protein